ncbi:hypothetical protein BKA69DRAFT_1075956 [Paraphysoderma sedebokerense]|nr:hypothetical protein BKA69DRAFT_1075956 [Paraphysoderma sedebokerense]
MTSTMSTQFSQFVRKHTPLIKFLGKRGGVAKPLPPLPTPPPFTPPTSTTTKVSEGVLKSSSPNVKVLLRSYEELPGRFGRLAVGNEEMDVVMLGGAN